MMKKHFNREGKLQDLPDDFTAAQFMALSHEELQKVEGTPAYWVCYHKGCNRKSAALDYSIMPWFYFRKGWHNWKYEFFLCGKHWKFYRRLGEWYIKKYCINNDERIIFKPKSK
jgi:hypothetical protein